MIVSIITKYMAAKKKTTTPKEEVITAPTAAEASPLSNFKKGPNQVVVNGEVVLDHNFTNPGVHSPRN